MQAGVHDQRGRARCGSMSTRVGRGARGCQLGSRCGLVSLWLEHENAFLLERCKPIRRSVPQGAKTFAAPDRNASKICDRETKVTRFANNAADHSPRAKRLSKEFTILWIFGVATPLGHMMLWFPHSQAPPGNALPARLRLARQLRSTDLFARASLTAAPSRTQPGSAEATLPEDRPESAFPRYLPIVQCLQRFLSMLLGCCFFPFFKTRKRHVPMKRMWFPFSQVRPGYSCVPRPVAVAKTPHAQEKVAFRC